jgi:hypothetical protein
MIMSIVMSVARVVRGWQDTNFMKETRFTDNMDGTCGPGDVHESRGPRVGHDPGESNERNVTDIVPGETAKHDTKGILATTDSGDTGAFHDNHERRDAHGSHVMNGTKRQEKASETGTRRQRAKIGAAFLAPGSAVGERFPGGPPSG